MADAGARQSFETLTNPADAALAREYYDDLVHPHRYQRRPIACHPDQANELAPRTGIARPVPHSNGSTQAFPQQLPGHPRLPFSRLTAPPRIRTQNSQVNELPRQVHDAEEQVQVDEDFRATERVNGRIQIGAGNRVRRDNDRPSRFFVVERIS